MTSEEQNQQLTEALRCCKAERAIEAAKLREEHKTLERRLSREIEYQQSVVAKLQEQLAHQQPSPPSDGLDATLTGTEGK